MIIERAVPLPIAERLAHDGIHPVLARLFAARGVTQAVQVQTTMATLLPPQGLYDLDRAASLLADKVLGREPILIVADYDCDGATACAVMVRGLRMFGANVDYLVPNRFEHGYGLTPPIVELAEHHPRLGRPSLIVTVDNGIASVDGVACANERGIAVLVTDHHLPGSELPAAAAIVNPNQAACQFDSKNLAGVGVAFYLLLGLRAELRRRDRLTAPEPPLQNLLDLVALGTVADLVKLDHNNRVLVAAGLRRIRSGKACAGIRALLAAAGREARRISCADMGFALGPRINAAGRMADISVGIECLITDDDAQAAELADMLDSINRERREREQTMREQALLDVADFAATERLTAVVHRVDWHEGIVGLVASRLKEKLHRPVFAFAPSAGAAGQLRGSGRSIAGVHLRDVLDLLSKRDPGLLDRFGGHAMAAGLSMDARHLSRFETGFEAAVREMADPACFQSQLLTDGALAADDMSLNLIEALDQQVWGQGFAEPLFCNQFEVRDQRCLKDRHLKLTLRIGTRALNAIWFDHVESLPPVVRLAYRLARNDYGPVPGIQLMIVGRETDPA